MCIAYFFFQNGNKLINHYGQFRAPDGHVSVSNIFKPEYENAIFYDYVLFMPYNAFGLPRGNYSLKFCVSILDNANKTMITSNDNYFTYQW